MHPTVGQRVIYWTSDDAWVYAWIARVIWWDQADLRLADGVGVAGARRVLVFDGYTARRAGRWEMA